MNGHTLQPATSGDRRQWLGIQYLRALAATSLVVFHYCEGRLAPNGHRFTYAQYRVDLFFIITGFILVMVARNETVQRFLFRRLLRVYPLYWVATALAICTYWAFDRLHPSGTELVKSLVLWPHFSEAHGDKIWPILPPGWTLYFEVYFYFLFAIGLATRRVILVPTVLICAAIAWGLYAPPQSAPLQVATHPILFEFVIGMVIASTTLRRPAALSWLGAGFAFAIVIFLAADWQRVAVAPIAALIVTATNWAEKNSLTPNWPHIRKIGDASFSIYLFHFPLLYAFERIVEPRTMRSDWDWLLAAVAVAGAITISMVLHKVLERPLREALRQATRKLFPLKA